MSSKKTYNELYQELQDVVVSIQELGQEDIDASMKAYAKAKKLVTQLEAYLDTAENTIRDMKES